MRIEQSQVGLSSSRMASVTDTSRSSMLAWVGDRPSKPPSIGQSLKIDTASLVAAVARLSDQARAAAQTATRATLPAVAGPKQASPSDLSDATDPTTTDPNLNLLIALIERMTGRKVHLLRAGDLKGNPQAQQATQQAAAAAGAATQAQAPEKAGWGVEIKVEQVHQETETTGFRAAGQITTSDGRAISFDYALAMHREFSDTTSIEVQAGDAVKKIDPIALNLTGGPVALSTERTAFDINSDGTAEQVALPASGTYFLTIDANGNGKVDNGSELFGPSTNNGFAELRQLDTDRNGWIDEGDAAYATLKLWSGSDDATKSLAEAGVGALYVGQAASTQFDIRSGTNEALGTIVSSSVYLSENGKPGALQQVDLTA